MILLCGIPSEHPLEMVAQALDQIHAPYAIFNQRQFATAHMSFEIVEGQVSGWLEMDGQGFPLKAIQGVYSRLMDYQLLPELKGEPEKSASRRYCAALHDTLIRWCELTPARVVNRLEPMGSNSSKPYQAQLIKRYGLEVPETLITNHPGRVLEFRERHGKIIYKSGSGVRSIVKTFDDEDLARLGMIRWCPTQFQQYIEGTDVRVHVVDGEVYPTQIISTATDYRYAHNHAGEPAKLTATEIPADVAEKCVRLTRGLGLAFSGIDLRFTPDYRVFCFEVNPCPGFSYYEANTGQPIALAVARFLAGQQ